MVITGSFEPGEGYVPGGGHTYLWVSRRAKALIYLCIQNATAFMRTYVFWLLYVLNIILSKKANPILVYANISAGEQTYICICLIWSVWMVCTQENAVLQMFEIKVSKLHVFRIYNNIEMG